MSNEFIGIVVLAGKSERTKLHYNKVFYEIMGKKVINYVLDSFNHVIGLKKLILVVRSEDIEIINDIVTLYDEMDIDVVLGGETRYLSVKNALQSVAKYNLPVVIHDAARYKITSSDITYIVSKLNQYDAISYYHDAVDTIKEVNNSTVKTLNRDNLKIVTTPQAFNTNTFKYLLDDDNNNNYFDELSILENIQNIKIGFLKETHDNSKITTESDVICPIYRVGHSLDFHPFKQNRKLVLGGVQFDCSEGLDGHSDGDSLYHSVVESILGALALGDIGTLFPDNDDRYLNIDSAFFLKEVKKILKEKNYQIVNIDSIIYLERPSLKNYKKLMANNIANLLGIDASIVNVKATTMEKKGPIGLEQGIASETIVLLSLNKGN